MREQASSVSDTASPPACLVDALEQIDTGVIAVDAARRITYVNAAACLLMGTTREALIGRDLEAAMPGVREILRAHPGVAGSRTPVALEMPSPCPVARLHVRAVPAADGLAVYLTADSRPAPRAAVDAMGEASLRAFMDAIPDGVLLVDVHGRILAANAAVAAALACPPDALRGSALADHLPPDVAQRRMGWVREALHAGAPIHREDARDGRIIDIWAAPVQAPEGATPHCAIFIRDITAQRQACEALRASEWRYRTLLDHTADWEYLRDPQGQFVYVSPAIERITGYTVEEWLADATLLERIILPDDRERVRAHDEEIWAAREDRAVDFRIVHRDGSIRWINHLCRPLYDEGGRLLGRRGNNREITERKQAEEALSRERAFLDAAIDVFPLPVTYLAPSGEVTRRNHAAERFMQACFPEGNAGVIPCAPHTTHPIPTHDLPVFRALQGETTLNFEHDLLLPDGRRVPLMTHAAPIRVGDTVEAAVVAFQDISAFREIDRAKDEFLAVLSHELLTPLTSMLGWSSIAMDRDTPEVYRQSMPIIHRNALRQQQRLTEMLDMSRLLQSRLEWTPEIVDLGSLACEVVDAITPGTETAGLELTLEPIACDLPVRLDARQMRKAIEHVLANAVKFTPMGGRITVACRANDDRAILTIADTGRGIAPHALPVLFTPFRQIDRDESAGGLGLGLAVARGIVELAGGTVRVESAGPGHGATVTLSIPLLSVNHD